MHKKYFFFDIDQTLGVALLKWFLLIHSTALMNFSDAVILWPLLRDGSSMMRRSLLLLMVLAVSLPMAGTALL